MARARIIVVFGLGLEFKSRFWVSLGLVLG